MAFYLLNVSDNKIIAESPTKSVSLDSTTYFVEGDDNLLFPILSEKITESLPEDIIVPWVVENILRLETYKLLKFEFEELNAEVIIEDYENGNLLPKLKKLARLKQLELILASGNF